MNPWIMNILLATCLYGVLNFLFKMVAEKKVDSDSLVNVVGGTDKQDNLSSNGTEFK